MRADMEFEQRADAIIRALLENPPSEPTRELEIRAAVTALDRAHIECGQKGEAQ